MAYIGNKPANKALVASDLDPAVITGQTALAVAPADTDEFLISDAGTLKRIDASLVGGGGITEADMWRTTASTSGASGTFTSNWERVDTYGFSHLGTGMTESSGVFTFPSTGFWRVAFQSNFTGTAVSYGGLMIMNTTDNSTYNQYVKSYSQLDDSGDEMQVKIEGILDITNVSTHKVRFDQQMNTSGGSWAGGDSNRTSATFIRLGDT